MVLLLLLVLLAVAQHLGILCRHYLDAFSATDKASQGRSALPYSKYPEALFAADIASLRSMDDAPRLYPEWMIPETLFTADARSLGFIMQT